MAKAKPKVDAVTSERRTLADELATLERDHEQAFARAGELRAALRKIATEGGASFQELIEGVGLVKVSPGHAGKFKGTFPTVHVKPYLALPEAKRKKLADDGIITMEPLYGGPYAGSTTVELFPRNAAA
jgi:hypothetical protein